MCGVRWCLVSWFRNGHVPFVNATLGVKVLLQLIAWTIWTDSTIDVLSGMQGFNPTTTISTTVTTVVVSTWNLLQPLAVQPHPITHPSRVQSSKGNDYKCIYLGLNAGLWSSNRPIDVRLGLLISDPNPCPPQPAFYFMITHLLPPMSIPCRS